MQRDLPGLYSYLDVDRAWMGTEARPPPSLHHRAKRDHHWSTVQQEHASAIKA